MSYIYLPFPKNGLQVFAEKNHSWLLVVWQKTVGNPWKRFGFSRTNPGFPLVWPEINLPPHHPCRGPGSASFPASSITWIFSQGIGLLFHRRSHYQKYARKGTRSKGRNGKRNPTGFFPSQKTCGKKCEDLRDPFTNKMVVKVYVGWFFFNSPKPIPKMLEKIYSWREITHWGFGIFSRTKRTNSKIELGCLLLFGGGWRLVIPENEENGAF